MLDEFIAILQRRNITLAGDVEVAARMVLNSLIQDSLESYDETCHYPLPQARCFR